MSEFSRDEKGSGRYFYNNFNLKNLEDLSFFIEIILLLGHGLAAVECSFIINGSLLDFDKSEESIVA